MASMSFSKTESARGGIIAKFQWAKLSAVLVCALLVLGVIGSLGYAYADVAVIRWSDVRQTITGFGGSVADFEDPLTPAQADFFFTQKGIGLSILRIQILPDAATCDMVFYAGACNLSNGQILNGELASAKMAVARGAIIEATPWSPPGPYKSNHSFNNGGVLLKSHYADWAREIASFVAMMTQEGVPIYAVSLQNEPDLATSYGSCLYNAQQIHDFVPYLFGALQAASLGGTKIMIAEQSKWAFDLTSSALADPKVAPEISILAAHGYSGEVRRVQNKGLEIWQSEDSSQSATYDGSMQDGLLWAQKMYKYLTIADVNAWLSWFLTDMPRQGEGIDNSALTDSKGNVPKRAYVIGQWSKFVRPGWSRVGVAYHFGHLQISAFKAARDQSFALVVVNPGKKSVNQTFVLGGVSNALVTPWITSEHSSLAAQAPILVRGGRFTYTIPGSSVVTFANATDQSR